MAKIGGVKGFWDILKSVSIAEIAQQANRPISLAIVGEEEARSEAIRQLHTAPHTLDSDGKGRLSLPGTPYVQGYDHTGESAGFPRDPVLFDVVIDVGGGRKDAPAGITLYSLSELGGWEATLVRILDDRPDLSLALAHNFPAFRPIVAQRIINETAMANAQFALITGISEALPITAILLPVNSLSDIIVLTKNQAMMVIRLAAAYGLPVDYKSRSKEVLPVLGNAFGWRAIARELIGAIPFVGFIARAMIAYAGTVTVGKAAMVYYETGENLTSAQAKRLYKEAYDSSREKIRTLADSFKKSRNGSHSRTTKPSEPLLLPPGEETLAIEADLPEHIETAVVTERE